MEEATTKLSIFEEVLDEITPENVFSTGTIDTTLCTVHIDTA